MDFDIYTADNAPENSRPLLNAAEENFGFIPNLLGEFAESPAVLQGYLQLNEAVSQTDFSPKEQQLAILAASIENKCHYCSAVHSTILKNQLKVDEDTVNAVRSGEGLDDPKLDALVSYTRSVVRSRGHVDAGEVRSFLDAGYSKRNLLEVNLIVTLKTLSNYTNHLADTPLDEAFKPEALEFAAV
ncbi:MAG: carboxymuconolactone decarboxylase family protein [Balneolaceae bacterium]|nr:carboxymuconolactone decarboxylase family protein [Balneolaceae bacterium]